AVKIAAPDTTTNVFWRGRWGGGWGWGAGAILGGLALGLAAGATWPGYYGCGYPGYWGYRYGCGYPPYTYRYSYPAYHGGYYGTGPYWGARRVFRHRVVHRAYRWY